MDPLDMRLLRALFRGGSLQIGALDPRLSAATMAEKIGAPRSTVQARLAQWRDTGFFAKSDVWPSPALFGVNVGGMSITVPDPRAKPNVLRDLRLVDGVLGYFDHLGPFAALQVIDENPLARERRLALLSRLPGVTASAILGFHPLPPVEPLTPLQWRIFRALRAEPDASLPDIAEKIGISARTLTRHYAELIETRRVWYVPLLDFSKFPGVVAKLTVAVRDADASAGTFAEFVKMFPDLVQHTHEHAAPRAPPSGRIELLLQFENAAAVDEAIKRVLDVPNVKSVETTFPLRFGTIPAWFDEKLA